MKYKPDDESGATGGAGGGSAADSEWSEGAGEGGLGHRDPGTGCIGGGGEKVRESMKGRET